MSKNYHFFWNGYLSQWFPSKFEENGIAYNTAEQYMMYHKAMLFNDIDVAQQILAATSPKIQKALGRKVRGFNEPDWTAAAKTIVLNGNRLKFTQNPTLLKKLLSVDADLFVEASPYDTIWGIGLNEADAKNTPSSQWRGSNWLGEVLTTLRNELLAVDGDDNKLFSENLY